MQDEDNVDNNTTEKCNEIILKNMRILSIKYAHIKIFIVQRRSDGEGRDEIGKDERIVYLLHIYFFRQITTFIKVHVAFVFGLQTF